jgi:hypothetical protein
VIAAISARTSSAVMPGFMRPSGEKHQQLKRAGSSRSGTHMSVRFGISKAAGITPMIVPNFR